MLYLSDLLNKKVLLNGKIFGEMVDFAVQERTQNPTVSKIVIKTKGKKLTISPTFLTWKGSFAILTDEKAPLLPFDEGDFYLNEDLLDKQVIDVDDKRLVRVNDIVFEHINSELIVVGIDIGAAGLIRRLGLRRVIKVAPKVLPWQMIEAFDYQTGNIKLTLSQDKLNSMHPSELADILEDLGTKERQGVVGSLEAKKAARAIERAEENTQEAILDTLPKAMFKDIVNKMHVSSLANVFYKLNPLRTKEMVDLMDKEKAGRVERLLDFGSYTAGGTMRTGFVSLDGNVTVKETINVLYKLVPKPEAIIVTNGNEKLAGIIYTKDILDVDSLAILKDLITERKFVYPQTDFNQVISLFGRYNLRALPVVDKDKKPIGVVTAGIVLSKVEEKTQTDEII